MAIVAIKEGNKEMRNAKINKDDFKHDYFLGKSGKVFGWLSLAIILIVYVIIGFLYFQANQNIDSDYDGVPDKIDNCYDEYGESENGCPYEDTDGDGVFDKDDNCVDESGPSENKGCPYQDSDGDGVSDLVDKCLSTPGKGENGCPLEGQIVFWFDSDRTGKWEGNVSIYFDNEYHGEINNWFTSNPGCGTDGCITITKPPGKYRWYAISENGIEWEGGDVEILEDDCNDQGLFIN